MLDLQKYESEAIANHRQQQQDLDNLLPIIEETGTLIIEKLSLFKKYNRKVRADVTHNGSHILLSVVITKIAPKRTDVGWLKAAYKISHGRLRIEMHGQGYSGIETDPEEIAQHFVTWYQARIEEKFRYALPF